MLTKILEIEQRITQQRQIIFEQKPNLLDPKKKKEAQSKITTAEETIEKIKPELKVIAIDIRKKKEHKQIFSQLRQAINDTSDPLKTMASVDGFFTIPAFLLVVEDICKVNEVDLANAFQRWCGKTLSQVFGTEEMGVILKKAFGNDLKTIFEGFINKNDIKNVTVENLHDLVKKTAESFFSATLVKPLLAKADDQIKDILIQLLHTEIFLQMLFALYQEADRKQYLDTLGLIWELGTVPEQYFRKPFLAINLTLSMVKINQNTIGLWEELTMWMKGFYFRTYNMIPPMYKDALEEVKKDSDGFYPTVDPQDCTLKARKGITKYDMAMYQLVMYELLTNLINVYKQNPEELVLPPLPAKPLPDDRVLAIAAKVDLKKMNSPEKGMVEIFEDVTHIQIVAVIPNQIQQLAEHLEHINRLKLNTKKKIVDDSVMQNFLEQYSKDSLENKCNAVDNCFNTYELTAMQLKLLSFIPDEIRMHVVRFLKDKEKSWWGSSEHIDEATQQVDVLDNDEYHDPVMLFQALYDFQKSLRSDDSQNLLPKINLILLAVYDYIRMGVLVEVKTDLLSALKKVPKDSKQSLFGGLKSSKREEKSKAMEQVLPSGVYTCEKEGFIYVVTCVEKSNAILAQHIKEINEIKVYRKFQAIDPNSIAKDLSRFQDADRADKARRFLFCLETFELHAMQANMLNFGPRETQIHYNKYLKEEKHFIWGWKYIFNKDGRRMHSAMAENQLTEFGADENKAVDPVNFFLSLKNNMIILYQDNSQTLLGKVIDIFVDGFTHLSKIIELKEVLRV